MRRQGLQLRRATRFRRRFRRDNDGDPVFGGQNCIAAAIIALASFFYEQNMTELKQVVDADCYNTQDPAGKAMHALSAHLDADKNMNTVFQSSGTTYASGSPRFYD